jgi:small-conductance mechanosensitive channel
MVQELDSTKAELKTTKQELETTKEELDTTKMDINDAARSWADDQTKLHESESRNCTLISKVTGDAARIAQLRRELVKEKEKVKANADAQVKLGQLKNQWTSMSTILSDSSSVPSAPPAPTTIIAPDFLEPPQEEPPPSYRPVECNPGPKATIPLHVSTKRHALANRVAELAQHRRRTRQRFAAGEQRMVQSRFQVYPELSSIYEG